MRAFNSIFLYFCLVVAGYFQIKCKKWHRFQKRLKNPVCETHLLVDKANNFEAVAICDNFKKMFCKCNR